MVVSASRRTGVLVAAGVAACLHGPLLPTPAERAMLRLLGASAATFGLAPELAAAALNGARTAPLVLLGGGWADRHLRFCVDLVQSFAPGRPPGLDATGASA
jgi:purine nucleoside phosphorylase